MKKIIFSAALVALGFFAGSCQRENLEPVADSTIVTYTVQVPGALATKADDGVNNVDLLVYEVYRTKGEQVTDFTDADNCLYHRTAEVKDGVATLPLEFVNDQNFTVLFWAYDSSTNVYDVDDLTNVTVASTAAANTQTTAAFSGVDFVVDCVSQTGGDVKLTRPVGQLNIATTDASLSMDNTKITVTESYIKVYGLSTSFNVATQEAGDVTGDYTCTSAAIPGGAFNTGYTYLAMNYIGFIPALGDNVNVDYLLKTSEGDIDYTIKNVPVKPNHRTNILGNLISATTDYTVTLDAEWGEEVYGESYLVLSDEELENALKSDAEVINVVLGADVNLNASDAYLKLGGEDTKTIIIDGASTVTRSASDRYTLNLETTYWSRLNTVNPEAKIVMKNLNLTSSQTSGTWNSYDVTFNCNVELENVNVLKALALDGEDKSAVFKNVNITETNDYYALWIAACGMTVEWDGGSIVSEGRGIKIDEQYVDEPAATSLKVANVSFKTAKKGAIMVKSSAETSVEVSNLDITGVAADPVNAVWVDEDAKDYFDLVTVEGTSKVQEGDEASLPTVVTSAAELQEAIDASPANASSTTVIYLKAGTYKGSFNVTGSRRIELMSNEDVVIDGLLHGDSGNYITLRGLTLTNATPGKSSTSRNQADGYCLGGYANCFHIEDCTFNVVETGAINIYAAFNACTEDYELTILNTVFNCNGQRPIRCKSNTYIDGCTFNDQQRYAMQFQANDQAVSEKVVFTNNTINNPCVSSKEPFAAGVQISHSQLCKDVALTISGNTLNSELFDDLKFAYDHEESSSSFRNIMITTCTLNGKQITEGQLVEINAKTNEVLPEALYTKEDDNTYVISTVSGLVWFADQVNVAANSFSGKTVKLAADVDLAGIDWIPVGQTGATQFMGTFDGQDNTISSLNIDASAQTGGNYSTGLFGWLNAATVKNVKVDGAKVKGNHNVGVIAGYLETSGCTVENCHVSDAAVECHHANNDACGDKAGVVVGHAGNNGVAVKACTATDSTLSAGSDAGQVVGAAKEVNVTECSASNVTVTGNDECTGEYIRNEVIGRIL